MALQDPTALKEAVAQYQTQLSQIQLAIDSSSPGEDYDSLLSLRSDIQELITLTQETLANVQKQHDDAVNGATETDPLDEEYALFKAELGECSSQPAEETNGLEKIKDDLKSLNGMKCQAPHCHQWGETSYHNALVCGVESSGDVSTIDEIQVRVLFTNPTHQEMRPCPYYLDGECRFSDEKCRFSHGELVGLSALKEYKEPDFTAIRPGLSVLVKSSDNLWHRGIITSLPGHNQCEVKLESSGKTCTVDLHDTLPLEEREAASSRQSESDDIDSSGESDVDTPIDEFILQQTLLRTPPASCLGDWEKHTTGFGSRLMAQMGYITGSGLGKNGEGRIEPVEAVILPAGKSLDHCMELKEKAGGDENLFKVEKRLKRLQKKQEQQQKQLELRDMQNTNVFDFINSKLGAKKGDLNELGLRKDKCKGKGTKKALKTESNKDLNLVGYQVGEEIRRAEQDLARMQKSLDRHAAGSSAHNHIVNQMQDKQNTLKQLKHSEHSINQEHKRRKNHQKMTIF